VSAPLDAIEVNPAERLPAWVRRFVDAGADPADDAGLRLRKRMLMLVVLFAATLVAVVLAATLSFGDLRSLVVPAVYFVVSLAGVAVLVLTKRVGPLLYSQLVMVLLLPAAQQWLLGGFVAGAGSVLYSMNAVLFAVVLLGARAARWWFAAFAAVVVLCGVLDPWLARTVPPTNTPVALFFVVTIVTVGAIAWLPLAFFVEARRRLVADLDRANTALDHERARSEALLLNVLPAGIATRLKDGERPIADRLEHVAVLFADLAGFTPSAQSADPDELIRTLDEVFSRFDALATEHGLEKIKTIGDAYMAVAGAPEPRPDAVARAARMALRMPAACADLTLAGRPLRLRVGLDAGPVVAGVIGRSKFAWDLYGDVVNTAARMESHGVPGRVQVTERFAAALPPEVGTEPRGVLEVKGKGPLRTFLLAPGVH